MQLLELCDVDMDGKMNEYDFICMISLFMTANTEERLESIFYLFDTDHSHMI